MSIEPSSQGESLANRTIRIGSVSVDTAEDAIVDAMYMLAEDHDAHLTVTDVVPGYDGVLAEVWADGVYPDLIEWDGSGRPIRVRIDLVSEE